MDVGKRRRALLELVIAFALVWGALGGYALATEPLSIAGLEIRKSPIVAAVEGEALVAEHALPGRWSFASPKTAEPTPAGADVPAVARAIDERPQRILIFGDSMIDELMLRLADYCLENGHTLKPAVWYGAGTVHWATDDKLKQLLRELEPTFAFVVLGANELTARNAKEHEIAVRRIVETLGEVPFVWLGPPNWQVDTGINDVIARAAGPGRYFRSADLELARKRDGIHPTREASAQWMDAVVEFVERESARPIRLSRPTREAPRPVAQVFPPPGRG
jgi:hypothetical protein